MFALFDAPWLPIYLLVLFAFDLNLGFFALGAVIVLALTAWLNERLTRSALKEANQGASDLLTLVSEQFKNAEVIKAMGMLPRLLLRWQKQHMANIHLQSEASKIAAMFGSVSRFIRLFLQSAILGLGAMLVIEDKISAGMMIAGSILLGRALSPLEQIIAASRQYSLAREAAKRLNALLKEAVDFADRMPLPAPQGHLAVENLHISLLGIEKPILANVTFKLSPGDVVAVIGPSGSGKSSLARTLVGVLQPESGTIRMDGADINDWPNDELGQYMGYLPQDVEIFDGTVAQNISRFEEINSEKVLQASLACGMHELILKLPQGYNTVLGTKAYRLSGGMQQRLGLARAIYGNPAFVVLDEPNSNLDQVGEEQLLLCIDALKKQKTTTVIVTHRTNILQVATHMLILAEGRMISFGPASAMPDSRRINTSDRTQVKSP
jgi:ATP-binding cassette subfamily C exporter for protease/lipase